jgi:membrane-associated HD superfamily phosphohydrolase
MRRFLVDQVQNGGRFFDNSRMLRYLILLLISIFLFLFVHNREVRIPMFELGTVASQYVVAEVPFNFVDEEATETARYAAGLDIGKILEVTPEDVSRRQLEFENSLVSDQWWRVMAPQATFGEMWRASDRLGKVLREIRFSDIRTIERMQQIGLDVSNFHEIVPIDLRQGICFTDKIWEFIRRRAFSDLEFQPTTVDFIVSYFRDKIWRLQTDTALARKIKKQLRQEVSIKYTSIPAGMRIIESGEKISSRQLSMLNAMKQVLAERRNLWHPTTILGSLLLTGIILMVCGLFLHCYHPSILTSNSTLFLISTVIVLGLIGAKVLELSLLRTTHGIPELMHYPLLTPFAGMLLCILIGPSVAVFFVAILAVLFNVCLAFEYQAFLFQNRLSSLRGR